MGFWDAIRGRTTPRAATLDALFSVPSAAMTLEAGLGLRPTGAGSVCFRAAEGQASRLSQTEATDLVGLDGGPRTETTVDDYGYTWLTVRTDPPDPAALVTDLHAVNSSLEAQGFSSSLLCSVIGFEDEQGGAAYLVYLYKQGTFYPFVPTGSSTRDTLRERQLRDAVGVDLPVEADTNRWMPIWGLPLEP